MKILLLACFLFFAGTNRSSAATYRDTASHISFEYDDTQWEPMNKKTVEQDTVVNLQRKVADKEGDTTYFSRISIVRDDVSKIKKVKESKLPKLQAYQSHAVEFLRGQRFDILSSEVKSLAGIPQGAFEILARQRDFGLTFQQVGFLEKDTAYLVTATVRTNKFPEYQSELKKIFDSLKVNP